MDKFYRIPIPIDHTATTKPRRTAKRKGKARGMVAQWIFAWLRYGELELTCPRPLRDQRRAHARMKVRGLSLGPLTRILIPAPAGKGGGT
jgi:hypothetical protein